MPGPGVGRGVAGVGQDEVEGIGVAGGDHAVEGRREREVAHPGLEPPLLALGHLQVGLGDLDVDLGLGQHGLLGEQLRVRPLDGRLGLVPRRDARLELVGRLDEDLGIDHVWSDLVLEPPDLRVPAVDLGLVLVEDRLGLLEARLGRLDVGRWRPSPPPWPASIRSWSSTTVAFFVSWSSTSSGTKRVASVWPFFTLSPMSTFHFSM